MVGLPGGLLGTARSAWSSAHFHYDPDYEQKKQRVLKGKFSKQLANYFPDVTTKRSVVSEESEDDAYDTDLDPDLGVLALERKKKDCERLEFCVLTPSSGDLKRTAINRLYIKLTRSQFELITVCTASQDSDRHSQ